MWVYYAILVTMLLLSWNARRLASVSKKYFTACVVLLFFFVGTRYAVGCDYFGYKIHFDIQNPGSFGDNIRSLDTLYWILIDLINYVGLPYEAVNVVTAAVFFSGFYVFARRFSNPMAILSFCFPLLIFAIPMSATRQALATGFLLIGLDSLMRGHYLRYGALVFLASQFHSSAILFMAFLPLVFWGGTFRAWVFATPFMLAAAYFVVGSEAYAVASSRYIEGNNNAEGAAFRTFVLFLFGSYYFIALQKLWRRSMPDSFRLINVGAYFLVGCFPASFVVPTIADRLGYYFSIFAAIIAATIPVLNFRNRDLVFVACALSLIAFFITWSSLSWQIGRCYVPYQSWVINV